MIDFTTTDPIALSRRRFIQLSSVAAAGLTLPAWLAEQAEAATPIGPTDGVVVLLTMAGGNDGLNTFAPVTSGAYRDARGSMAISANQALPMSSTRGMNPNLPHLKSRWDRGEVAVIDGVGRPASTLSHFVSMAQVMSARSNNVVDGTGWLGRYLDNFSADPFRGFTLGTTVPLLMNGRHRRATTLSERRSNFLNKQEDQPTFDRQKIAMKNFASASYGRGPLVSRVTANGANAVALSNTVGPLVQDKSDEPAVVTKMRLAARLINANLGVRVISVLFGDFDTHANQQVMHRDRMRELDSAIQVFDETLRSAYAGRTIIVGTSEFGRRVAFNGEGTDHGTANSLFVVGSSVVGGFHGAMPSLTNLDRDDNMVPTVDINQVYGNVATQWLGADSRQLIGSDFGNLGFLGKPSTAAPTTTGTPPKVDVGPIQAGHARAQIARLYLAVFLRLPDEGGHDHWVKTFRSGMPLKSIADEFAKAPEFLKRYGAISNEAFVEKIYQNVLGRNSDSAGREHWLGLLNSGTRRGDVIVGFSESSEFIKSTAQRLEQMEMLGPIGRLYWAYFLRKPDRAGLNYWAGLDASLDTISEAFAGSSEFIKQYGSINNDRFVELVYRNVLGRKPDQEGFAAWKQFLDGGASRGSLMIGFSNSPEFVKRINNKF